MFCCGQANRAIPDPSHGPGPGPGIDRGEGNGGAASVNNRNPAVLTAAARHPRGSARSGPAVNAAAANGAARPALPPAPPRSARSSWCGRCCSSIRECMPSGKQVAKFALKAVTFIAIVAIAILAMAAVLALASGMPPFLFAAVQIVSSMFIMYAAWQTVQKANNYINEMQYFRGV